MIDLDRIDEYCRKATEEPWRCEGQGGQHMDGTRDFYQVVVRQAPYRRLTSYEDCDFAAQARTDLPAVVAELREARELLERLCDGLSAGHGWGEAYEEACEFLEVTE